ncbi:MAG TPA: carboxymuconolactone decarboxylase [Thermodesulfobacteriota bacterium]|nr:carboxymuconolactone decarboxylase [Thermodesulfobacteriota bacterium]
MKISTIGMLVCGVLIFAGSAAAQEDMRRFRLIPFSEMTPEQRAYADAVKSGPTSGTGSAALASTTSIGAPFNVYLRSPILAQQLLKVAEHIRFKSSLPPRLNEFAILITARYWTAQYEWFAHHRLALKAGLDPAVAEDLAQGRRPANMKEDEAVVYDFSSELHKNHGVSDAVYKAAVDKFGEQGVVDLIAVNGYYGLVSMILNVDRTPIPGGGKPPLPVLK